MNRLTERLIDLAALAMFLSFAYAIIKIAPELAGGVVVAAGGFWLTKNASAPHPTIEQAAALAAEKVLETAASREARHGTQVGEGSGDPNPA